MSISVLTSPTSLPPPPGELLPGSHLADEDEPDLLLVSGFRFLSPLCPPGGPVSAHYRWPAFCDRDQRLRCGHGWEEQLLWSVSRQLEPRMLMWRNWMFCCCFFILNRKHQTAAASRLFPKAEDFWHWFQGSVIIRTNLNWQTIGFRCVKNKNGCQFLQMFLVDEILWKASQAIWTAAWVPLHFIHKCQKCSGASWFKYVYISLFVSFDATMH